ncbi:MAG TPA: chromosome segregation SMC family protein [Candidatus Bipolaricaulis anaerobius]|nr:chromosome segregation SMC family protein [Candidatus Bipolaricaulis anaerobius]
MTAIVRLTVHGFKSFRRRVTLDFYPGFTAIIGENGTGKSNLLDALTFVMGRRSRSLRAERIEHLLHSPANGDPVDEAEVILTLDNRAGTFHELLPDAGDEVQLARRINRTSSTYRIQGRVVAARDVEALLDLAGIEPDGYHIVEQGMVIDVLERSPRERREILDEVAGIAAYEERKARAIEELGEVKERLNTSRILLAERRQRLAALYREREAALEYQALAAERERIAATLAWRRFLGRKMALDKAHAQGARLRDAVADLAAEVERLDREIEARERRGGEQPGDNGLADLVRGVERLRGALATKEAEARLTEREIASLKETIRDMRDLASRPDRPPEAVESLLALRWNGVKGTLSQLATPKEGMEVAFATAVGGHAHDLVVETRDLALKAVQHLKEHKAGRARFLPLDRLAVPPVSPKARAAARLPGVLGLAADFVTCPPDVRPALLYVVGDTLIAESLEAVRDVLGVRVVTVDGDLLERGGAILGGSQARRSGVDLAPRQAQLRSREQALAQLRAEMEKLSAELATAEATLAARAKSAANAQTARASEESDLQLRRDRRREAYRELERQRANLARYEREAAEIEGELAALGGIAEPAGGGEQGSLEVLQARLRQAERRQAELGTVNLRAITDYDAFLAEFQDLKDRVATLDAEKHEIERFIGEIEAKKKEKFLATMETVSAELDRLFQVLFGGGEAHLALAEPGNIASGLLIAARPPGKEPRLLDALSGGEKTLVAIAFVLALAAGRPAPFYFLDEVDAALDRANSERLARLLREFARQAQVVMISHNEEVVRYADRVYGVLLRDGSSAVVGMELEHARA